MAPARGPKHHWCGAARSPPARCPHRGSPPSNASPVPAPRPPRINPGNVQQVALAVGHTVWQLQLLEDVIGAHLALLHDLQPGCSHEAVQAAVARYRKLTFGQLLGALDKALGASRTLSAPIRARLEAVKEERNWLVHRSRRDAHVDVYTADGTTRVLARIDTLHASASDLMRDITADTQAGLQARGLDVLRIVATADDVARSWERGERHPGEVLPS